MSISFTSLSFHSTHEKAEVVENFESFQNNGMLTKIRTSFDVQNFGNYRFR